MNALALQTISFHEVEIHVFFFFFDVGVIYVSFFFFSRFFFLDFFRKFKFFFFFFFWRRRYLRFFYFFCAFYIIRYFRNKLSIDDEAIDFFFLILVLILVLFLFLFLILLLYSIIRVFLIVREDNFKITILFSCRFSFAILENKFYLFKYIY